MANGAVTPTDSLLSDPGSTNSNFSMSLFSISFRFGSGSITPDWINNQLFGGKDLRDSQERKNFIKGISNNIAIKVPVYSSLPLLNFSYGSNAFSLGQIVSYTSMNIPSKLVQVPFEKEIGKYVTCSISKELIFSSAPFSKPTKGT